MEKLKNKLKNLFKIKEFYSVLKAKLTNDVKIVPIVDEKIQKTLEKVREYTEKKDTQSSLQTEELQKQTDIIAEIKKTTAINTEYAQKNYELTQALVEATERHLGETIKLSKIALGLSIASIIISITLSALLLYFGLTNSFDRETELLQELTQHNQMI